MLGVMMLLFFVVGVYYVMLKRGVRPPSPSGGRSTSGSRWVSLPAAPALASVLDGLLAALAVASIVSFLRIEPVATLVLGAGIGVLAGVFGPRYGSGSWLDLVYSMIGLWAVIPAVSAVLATDDCFGPLERGGRILALITLALCMGVGLIAGWYRRTSSLAKAGLGIFAMVEVLLVAVGPIGSALTGDDGQTLVLMMTLVALLGGLVGFWAELTLPVVAVVLAVVSFYEATLEVTPGCMSGSPMAAIMTMTGFGAGLAVCRRFLKVR